MFLRCALASAERALELAPFSVECATLRACILSLITTVGDDDSGGGGGGGSGVRGQGGGIGGDELVGGGGGESGGGGGAAEAAAAAAAAKWETQLARALAACRHAIRIHDRRGAGGDFEMR